MYLLVYNSGKNLPDIEFDFISNSGIEIVYATSMKSMSDIMRENEAAAVIAFYETEDKNALDFLIANKDVAIIYLYRGNMLRRYLSGVFLRKTKIAASEKNIKIQKAHVDPEEMMTYLDILTKETDNEKKMLSKLQNHQLIAIKYEDYFANAESILAQNEQVFEFLGVKPIQVTSKQKKILPQSWSEQIENYDEFRNCLTNTKYQQYLD